MFVTRQEYGMHFRAEPKVYHDFLSPDLPRFLSSLLHTQVFRSYTRAVYHGFELRWMTSNLDIVNTEKDIPNSLWVDLPV